jgi:hypothetical protein
MPELVPEPELLVFEGRAPLDGEAWLPVDPVHLSGRADHVRNDVDCLRPE